MGWEQIIKETQEEAIAEATRLAASCPYVAVVLSRGKYYIEQEPVMIRTWESLIAEFENGELINQPT